MLTLYHYDRSTAAQRVRLGLEEKKLEWHSEIVDTAMGDASKRPEGFHKLNPKGLIPLLVHDEFALPESTLILEYLEEAFPKHDSLTPKSPQDRARMRLWMRRIEDGIHVASRTIGVCIVNRFIYKEAGKSKLQDYYMKMRDTTRKNNDQINTELGLNSPLLKPAIHAFKKLFQDMDDQLANTPWLSGPDYTIADISLVVYLTRMTSFQMSPLWDDFTFLRTWFDKIRDRDAYRSAVDDWGDVTAERRRQNGIEAFETIKNYWNEDS